MLFQADSFWTDVATPFLLVGAICVGLIVMVLALHFLIKGIEWCRDRVVRWWRNRNKPTRPAPPNPWEHQAQPPPPPPYRAPRKQTPKYVQQEQHFEDREEQGHRSPVRLLHSAAFERLTDGELEEIRCKAPEVIPRLRRCAELMARCQTKEAENLLFVLRAYVRSGFGQGAYWLEAVIISDIAALAHHANKAEDAAYHFAAALRIATPWFDRYPWLKAMVTQRRLIRSK